MAQHHKDFLREFLNLVLKFNGFNLRITPLWRSIARTFSRKVWNDPCPVLEFNRPISQIIPLSHSITRTFSRKVWAILCM